MRIEFDDIREFRMEDFIKMKTIDLSDIEWFHVAFIGFLYCLKKHGSFKIIYPKNNFNLEGIKWIESIK